MITQEEWAGGQKHLYQATTSTISYGYCQTDSDDEHPLSHFTGLGMQTCSPVSSKQIFHLQVLVIV
jgi:hypothetical protein